MTAARKEAPVTEPSSVVIVGAGLAGAKAAEALRTQGYSGPVTLLGAEALPPYERPPLSKGYLAGKAEFDEALVHPQGWYAENNVELRCGVEVAALDRSAKEVVLTDGSRVGFGSLILATGSEPRRLPIPGAERALLLRTRDDADAIRATFGAGQRLVIIGGGWIGLEVAAAAREAGTDVTILEAAALPLLAVLGTDMATVFADLHREHGVDLRLGVALTEVTATGVRLADGTEVPADAVVMGVGVRPRTELAASAGLEIDNGVLVDGSLRSSDPNVFAVGDIANHQHPVLGRRVRVEHWATALNQPPAAVAALLGGETAYDELPYFFSDQYDLGMEYIGNAPPGSYTQVVVRGDVSGREFVAFWLDADDRIQAAMNVNVWDVVDEIKPLIAGQVVVSPDRLVDAAVPLAEVAR
jgi:3-phenylpropionate/trans-cinnamate dioxygenase ferredoxin reductase component